MDRDLFQIVGTDDIYFTLGMWAMLSPRLLKRASIKNPAVSEETAVTPDEPMQVTPVELKGANRVL